LLYIIIKFLSTTSSVSHWTTTAFCFIIIIFWPIFTMYHSIIFRCLFFIFLYTFFLIVKIMSWIKLKRIKWIIFSSKFCSINSSIFWVCLPLSLLYIIVFHYCCFIKTIFYGNIIFLHIFDFLLNYNRLFFLNYWYIIFYI
jgi:hypothetical protein